MRVTGRHVHAHEVLYHILKDEESVFNEAFHPTHKSLSDEAPVVTYCIPAIDELRHVQEFMDERGELRSGEVSLEVAEGFNCLFAKYTTRLDDEGMGSRVVRIEISCCVQKLVKQVRHPCERGLCGRGTQSSETVRYPGS